MARHTPYTIKIELVRGCSMRCPFCAITTMPWKDEAYCYMSEEVYNNILDDLVEWRPKVRVEFAERGEQTFHPNLLEYVKLLRLKLPKAQLTITSNGDMIRRVDDFVVWVDELLNAGVNVMMLDCYNTKRYRTMKELFPDAKLFYEDNFHPYRYISPKIMVVLLVDGTHKKNHKIRRWHNAAGSVDIDKAEKAGYIINTVDAPMNSMCVRPFREMEIHYDGTVTLCCNDWKEDCIIGNVMDLELAALWQDMDEQRKLLLGKRRDLLSPCDVCSERAGFRVGLEMRWFK